MQAVFKYLKLKIMQCFSKGFIDCRKCTTRGFEFDCVAQKAKNHKNGKTSEEASRCSIESDLNQSGDSQNDLIINVGRVIEVQ
jgi:hypothetical protein